MIPNIHKHDEIVRTLRLIQSVGFKSAVIAGGVVRDLYFGVQPTDIDIFIWDPLHSDGAEPDLGDFRRICHPDKGAELVWRMMKLKHPQHPYHMFSHDEAKRSYSGYNCSRITTIWNVTKNFLPYQLIFIKNNPLDHIDESFDFGICKCYCDGTKFRFTPDFMHDARKQRITLVAKDITDGEYRWAMEKHLPKVQAKYPGFTFKVAPWNNELVAKYTKK